jgi:flagellar hook assembly protein FlgD
MDYTTMILGDLVKKVGPNYAVELGKVIGAQVEVTQKEKQRDYNIWIDYAKEFQNIIKFQIPTGYKAEGLENFNFNVDNTAGAFVSKASLVGNQVIITTSKKYKANYLPKEEWNNLTACLDAAFNFTQKKLILKKN